MVELTLYYNADKMELKIFPIDSSRIHNIAEVVRCEDCKHYTDIESRCDHPMQGAEWCYDCWIAMGPNDFCSYGERKDNE